MILTRTLLSTLLCVCISSTTFAAAKPSAATPAAGAPTRLKLTQQMVTNEATHSEPLICDEQDSIGDPPANEPKTPWATDYRGFKQSNASAHIDLGSERHLSTLWIYDINATGELEISAGKPGQWTKVTTYPTDAYKRWVPVQLDVTTRYLRLHRLTAGAQIAEIALYEYTPDAWAALLLKKQADAKAAEEKKAALARAQEEAKNRPLVDAGEPFGKLPLVDEIDCAAQKPDHLFVEVPGAASRIESILGQPCRTMAMQPGESSYLSWRIGRFKLLKPGAAYLLTLEYPEDAPRTLIVMNGGCETSRGFHTGNTTGDALRAKYVWSNPESISIPLSGKYQAWQQLFFLHDRFPERAFIRGGGLRALTPDDGFAVTIAQFSAQNDPPSRGLAVRRIRLFEVPEPRKLDAPIAALPQDLPRRQIFWREEMADGVIDSAKPEERGVAETLNWYRYKARLMHFLGINTFTKDLLEFGACQHWDSTAGGGNNWVFFAERHKNLWSQIVAHMSSEGFSILPYYEYSGSKGYKGLGNQRRAKPLKRDDAYTHIKWIEASNADITDPDTIADFQKMLDITVVQYKDKARFSGIWIRPRMQLPISFAQATLGRFAKQANGDKPVTRTDLAADKQLLARYYQWWQEQRRAFLLAMRDHLRNAGVNPEAVILFTADASEPGAAFPMWEKRIVTDDPTAAAQWLAPGNAAAGKDRPITPITPAEVLEKQMFLQALQSGPLDWGGWEVSHASPAADPAHYRDTPGVMLTHGFHRAYSVASPATFDAFRTPSGLALVRHYSLNENMMCDKEGKDILGYFVADVERAGPYCMLAEARAMANGDPFMIGYLAGNSYNRGFPQYARGFNSAFLSLPALPSQRLDSASSDRDVVVRSIATKHGTWLAVVNTSLQERKATISLPAPGNLVDAPTGAPVERVGDTASLTLRPCQLRALQLKP